MKAEITVNPKEFGIEEKQAQGLLGNLPQIKEERGVLESQYSEVIKLDIEDPETVKKARELRLLIKNNRTQGIEVWHKTNKEVFLRGGQFVDAVKNAEIVVNKRMEENLEQIEKHAEIKEKARIEALNKERIDLVLKYNVDGTHLQLGTMSNDVWDAYFSGIVSKYEQEQERIAREEEERQKQIKIQQLHNERKELALPYYQFWDELEKTLNFGEQSEGDFNNFIARIKKSKSDNDAQIEAQRIENERLKKEAEEKEKALEAERKKQAEIQAKKDAEAQAKLKAEQDAKTKLEAELQAKKDAEIKAENERLAKIEAEKKEAEKLAKAPIKNQLTIWVDSFSIPKTNVDNATSKEIIAKFEAFKTWAKTQIENL